MIGAVVGASADTVGACASLTRPAAMAIGGDNAQARATSGKPDLKCALAREKERMEWSRGAGLPTFTLCKP